jgi:hypothetical protein
MKLIASIATTVALVLPAASFAAGPPNGASGAQPPSVPGGPPVTVVVPGSSGSAGRWPAPTASLAARTTAYGTYCRGESHKRVAHQRGTPFATCLTAMARLATDPKITPPVACARETKRRVKGRQRSPFVQCVLGGAKLLGSIH